MKKEKKKGATKIQKNATNYSHLLKITKITNDRILI